MSRDKEMEYKGLQRGIQETKQKVLELLKLCKVCRGAHGEWIEKEWILKEVEKL